MREAWRKLVIREVGRLERSCKIKRDGLSPLDSAKLWLKRRLFKPSRSELSASRQHPIQHNSATKLLVL